MNTVSAKSEPGGACAFFTKNEINEAAKLMEKNVKDLKAAGVAAMEDTEFAARRLLKRGRFAVENGLDETAYTIRRHPVGTAAAVFATGVALGFLLPRFMKPHADVKV